jgi:hypothetical protein
MHPDYNTGEIWGSWEKVGMVMRSMADSLEATLPKRVK